MGPGVLPYPTGTRIRALSSVGRERLPYKQEVAGSNPAAPIELTGFRGSDVRYLCSLNGSRTGPPAVTEGLSEPILVGPLVALEHRLGRLPAAEVAEHLERLIHEVRGELPPQGVPAAATLGFQPRACHSLIPPVTDQPTGSRTLKVLRRGQQRNVPDPGVPPPRLLKDSECLGGYRRPVIVACLFVFCAPPHHSVFKVNARPPKLTDGTVAGFRSLPKKRRNIFIVARSYFWDPSALVGVTSSP